MSDCDICNELTHESSLTMLDDGRFVCQSCSHEHDEDEYEHSHLGDDV